ncbi:hypothetical protein MGYG_01895 [Nannizzia gypsea CBS 118893]|uniref:Uncharacterized protein n=1 Tax=Arthroderma gypseum (strain ATCC MYA-4604 / CBS 118893) TaxID=535722 RepID=E5QYL8_ARTGP|nr:hypothetical protein MGYG_01895 [Nannizzia gypsea CBS 118893]EFQ98881.1 hypothetical protein MGYG_01895 [Nannizzia gypsea CBS 118893]
MEFVPALCAAGTIGIAPAGLALGRPEASTASSTARRPSALAYQRASFFAGQPAEASLQSPLAPLSPLSLPPVFSPLHEPESQLSPSSSLSPRRLPLDEELSTAAKLDALIQRTDEKILLRPRRENNQTVLARDVEIEPEQAPALDPSASARPSSSWVRRLSTITSSVYGTTSSAVSSRPQSPSVNGSTAPFFPQKQHRSNRSSLPPNKLVKRSTSQLDFPDSPTSPCYSQHPYHDSSRPRRSNSIIRRPATSHQRSAAAAAAMRNRSATESNVLDAAGCLVPPHTSCSSSSPLASPHHLHPRPLSSTFPSASSAPAPSAPPGEPVWRPYFRGIASNFSSIRTRRRSSSVRQRRERSQQQLHLLLEQPDVVPTLVLASAIKPQDAAHTPPRFSSSFKSSEQPRQHLHQHQRQPSDLASWSRAVPVARSQVSRMLSSKKEQDSETETEAEPESEPEPALLLSTSAPLTPFAAESTTKNPPQPWEESIAKLQRRQQRASLDLKRNPHSDSEVRTSKSERLSGNSMRSRRRKNITDPDIFQRPATSHHHQQQHQHQHQPLHLRLHHNQRHDPDDHFDTNHGDNSHHDQSEDQDPLEPVSPKTVSKAKPRLRHLPQFHDLRNELLNERRSAPSSASGSRQSSAEQKIYSAPRDRDRDQRLSVTASDPASTVPGSDNDTRIFSSGEEDETDCHSDTIFDSYPTRATSSNKSTSTPRGPRIDTLFDKPDDVTVTPKQQQQPQNYYPDELHLSSSVVSSVRKRSDLVVLDALGHNNGSLRHASSSEAAVRRMSPSPKTVITGPSQRASRKSSYFPAPSADSAEKLRFFAETSDDDYDDDDDDDDDFPMALNSPPHSRSAITLSKASEAGSRMSVFDWSEQQKPSKDGDSAGYRPKTAHEKNLLDLRGGRSTARSAPNTLHLRSQSVPIATKESTGQKDAGFPLKFGTWGLGNKGPSEDWDGDFDFEDSDDQPFPGSLANGKCSTSSMKVPQAILDRQESVHGQYGLVQELTVLVEELKRLQAQAKALNILEGQSGELWKEAQGIINLATLEEDDDQPRSNGCSSRHQRQRSSSATTFDSGNFGLEASPEPMPMATKQNSNESQGQGKQSSPLPGKENADPSANINATFPLSKKPRRESSVRARSVLDNIHHLRELHNGNSTASLPTHDSQQRFAFDTQSLRDLVVRAGAITRSLKDIVRKAEGVYVPSDTNYLTPDPPFSQIFVHPSQPIPANGLS